MIIDSSSLIIFAKINKLELLLKLYNKISITKGIFSETVEKGMDVNAPDAKIIKNFVDNKKIIILHLDKKYNEFSLNLRKTYFQLGIGESDAISLALQDGNKTLVMDEAIGRKVAKLYNVKPKGSLRILLDLYRKNIINEKELRNIVDEMVKNKFRVGADVTEEFWAIFELIKKRRKTI